MSKDDEEPAAAVPDPPPKVHQHGRSKGEVIFLVCLIVGTLLTAIGFVLATIVGGYGFSSTFVAILMGLCVATLAYTFLGGVAGAVFKLGGIELAGSVAVIAAVVYLVKGPLGADMNDARAIQNGRNAEALLDQERAQTEQQRQLRRAAEQRTAELEDRVGTADTNRVASIVAAVRGSNARSPLGRGVLDLYRSGAGPFNRTLATVQQLPVRFNQSVAPGTFQYCHERRGEFDDKPVMFQIVNAQTGEGPHITLEPGDDIGQGVCSQIQFDVFLGCDAIAELVGTKVERCDARGGIAWSDPSDNRIYNMTATVLNPDLVPRSSVGGARH